MEEITEFLRAYFAKLSDEELKNLVLLMENSKRCYDQEGGNPNPKIWDEPGHVRKD